MKIVTYNLNGIRARLPRLLLHRERHDLPQSRIAPRVDRHVAARLQLEPVQRRLVAEAAAVDRGGQRQDGPLELLPHTAVGLDPGLQIAHRRIVERPRMTTHHPVRVTTAVVTPFHPERVMPAHPAAC